MESVPFAKAVFAPPVKSKFVTVAFAAETLKKTAQAAMPARAKTETTLILTNLDPFRGCAPS